MSNVPELQAIEAVERIAALQLIDVRAPFEFDGPLGHIPGAELHPLDGVGRSLADRDRSEPMLLICRSGRRSKQACELLMAEGFESVTNLSGGMIAWNRAELDIERTEPATLAELRDRVLEWFASTLGTQPVEARSALDNFFEGSGASFDEPTSSSLDLVLHRARETARACQADPLEMEAYLAGFRQALAVL